MVILGGWVFLMSEVPLYTQRSSPVASLLATNQVNPVSRCFLDSLENTKIWSGLRPQKPTPNTLCFLSELSLMDEVAL